MFARPLPFVLAVTVLGGSAGAAVPLPPKPTKYATDKAQAFPPARLSALNEKLATFERQTSNQVVVYVDRRLPAGTTLEEMASAAVRTWRVGQKGDNGVILFVFVDDRKMRIEVGYGLEGALPDAAAHRITDEVIKPFFKKGDYPGGVEAGADAIMAAVRAEGNKGTGVTANEKAHGVQPGAASAPSGPTMVLGWLCPVTIFLPLLLWPLLRGFARAVIYGMAAGSLLSFVIAIAASDGLWFVAGVVFGFVSLMTWVGRMAVLKGGGFKPRRSGSSASSWTSGDSSGSSWSSSSSDSSSSYSSSDSGGSSSDFSGGGGDSGGGGSSDSW